MAGLRRRLVAYAGRPFLFALGALYVSLGASYPVVPQIDEPLNVDVLMAVLVAGPGLFILAGAYNRPSLDVDPAVHPVVSKWYSPGSVSCSGSSDSSASPGS